MSNGEDEMRVHTELKREAVALLESSGRPQMQVATELGIQPSMLRQRRAMLNGGLTRAAVSWIDGSLATKPGCVPVRPGRRDRPTAA